MPRTRTPPRTLLLLALVTAGCGAAGDDSAATNGSSGAPAPAAEAAGTLTFGEEVHSFQLARCDPDGRQDGILLRGRGSAEDGRTITIEVERLSDGETVEESALVGFGSMLDGDFWEADRRQYADGSWFADEAGMEPVEGGIIQVSGREIVVEGEFRHSDGETREVSIRATCP